MEIGTYWLHILESKSPQAGFPSTYLLARANAPLRNAEGGAMPTVHYPSWEQLHQHLVAVGIRNEVLRDAKRKLDSDGSHTIPEVVLSQGQLEQLGFTDLKAA